MTRRWHRQRSSKRRQRALDAEVRTDGGALVVGGCRVGRYGRELTPLWRAANYGQVQTARRLLAGVGGVEVDRATANGMGTPLLQASDQGFVDMATLLLEHRAVPDKSSVDGMTPLLFAAQKGFVEVAKVLLEHRADPDKSRDDGVTPLLRAALKGFVDVAKLLLEHRGRPEQAQCRRHDSLALHAAHERLRRRGHSSCWSTGPTSTGRTPRSKHPSTWHPMKGHVSTVRLFLLQNADVTVEDKWGDDALASARQQNHHEVVQLLVQAQRREE